MLRTGILLCVTFALQVFGQFDRPLDEYVRAPDDTFSWEVMSSFRDEERQLTVYNLNMTSLTWFDETVSDRPVWFHYMVISVPDVVDFLEHATVFISDRSNTNAPPTPENDLYLPLAMDFASRARAVTALLCMIPNQPIRFPDDPKQMSRSEDAIIAFTWRKYAELDAIPDMDKILLFPMTKATIRGMDATQEFSALLGIPIQKFMLIGGSKRGWSAYLAAATDPEDRAFCIVPMVFTILDIQENLMLHYRAMGGWSWAMQPYYDEDLTQYLTLEEASELSEIDPFTFRDRLTMPKMLISATGDEFFFPHETHLFFDRMEGPIYYYMMENTQHFLIGQFDRIVNNAASFFIASATDFQLPQVSWDRTVTADGSQGSLTLRADVEPLGVTRWTTTTSGFTGARRDFRLLVLRFGMPTPNNIVWIPQSVAPNAAGEYEVTFDTPDNGWRAFFMTARFPGPSGFEFETTTEVHFLPDEYPFPRCEGDECIGQLV